MSVLVWVMIAAAVLAAIALEPSIARTIPLGTLEGWLP